MADANKGGTAGAGAGTDGKTGEGSSMLGGDDAGDKGAADGQQKATGTDQNKDGASGDKGGGSDADKAKAAAEKTAKEAADKKVADEKAAADAKAKDFELKAPEGSDFDADGVGGFKKFAVELGLDGEKAQKALDFVGKLQNDAKTKEKAAYQQQQKDWQAELKADKEFGGDKLVENLKAANRALTKFAPELKPFLKGGLGNHPELVKAFIRIGLADADDSIAGTQSGGAKGAQSQVDALKKAYPNSPELFAGS